jgi:hypothetical protein
MTANVKKIMMMVMTVAEDNDNSDEKRNNIIWKYWYDEKNE